MRQSGHHVMKPVMPPNLLGAVLEALNQSRRPPALKDAAPPSMRVSPLRVLLVEDNVVNQKVAGRLLEKQGHSVAVACDGHAALDALARGTFDLVFMDVQMPEMDGYEATKAIRARERETGGHIPIIALTAHAMKGDREICLQAGMDGYLNKPLRPQELTAAIERYSCQGAASPLGLLRLHLGVGAEEGCHQQQDGERAGSGT
jgi:CheY-like chemotaxis protein